MEDLMKMKTLSKILFVFFFMSLVFTFAAGGVLNTDVEEKAEKKVIKAKHEHKDKHECTHDHLCCPVCKKHIDKKDAKFKAEYNGKTFYFASEKCKAEFQKNPEKYDKACCETYYVCPMKQCNVKSDKPGKCPRCGMELKKVVKHAEGCEMHKKDQKHEGTYKHCCKH
jgi:YHS domain-containing protein